MIFKKLFSAQLPQNKKKKKKKKKFQSFKTSGFSRNYYFPYHLIIALVFASGLHPISRH